MYKIVIDTKGSDKGSAEAVKGAFLALERNPSLEVLLVGDGEALRESLADQPEALTGRVEILDAPDEVTNYDDPSVAVFKKTESSMMKSLMALSERDELIGMITAGNTGAVIAGSLRYLSAKERVRPCLAAILPAADGSFTCLVDTGATIDCTPSMLLHFAKLGTDLMRKMYGIESPRVGLLSNGSEPTKGNKLVKETHLLLKDAEELNFVGNVEGNVALSGICDVLVCDGFAGNQVLKVSEGMATRLITDMVKYAKKTGSDAALQSLGWKMGLEPTTPGTTIQCSNRLSYIHHLSPRFSRTVCKGKNYFSFHQNFMKKFSIKWPQTVVEATLIAILLATKYILRWASSPLQRCCKPRLSS